jgi:hypothetical protein
MTDSGYTIFVPPGHAAYIYPLTTATTEDNAQKAAHHITNALDEGEDG